MLKEYFYFNDDRLKTLTNATLKSAVMGESDEFIKSIDVLLDMNPELMQEYAQNYANKMMVNQHIWGLKGVMNSLNTLTLKTLALYEVFDNLVFVGIDLQQGFKKALYTNNFQILDMLQKGGLLQGDLEELYEKYQAKRRRMLKEGIFTLVRLDIAELDKEGVVQFKPTIPNYMPILGEQRFFLTPISALYDFENFIRSNPYPIRFNYVDLVLNEEKNMVGTLSPEVISQIYPPDMFKSRVEQIDGIGYSPYNLNLNLWDLESSKYDIGIRQLRIEYLARLDVLPLDAIDKNLFDLGVEVQIYFNKKTMKLTTEQMNALVLPEGVKTNRKEEGITVSLRESIVTYGNSLSKKRLYYFMQLNGAIYGDVQQELERLRTTYQDLYKGIEINLPEDINSRVMMLKTLAKDGIVEFTYQNKKGGLSKKRMTNNRDILLTLLNPFYVERYESIAVRLRALTNIIASSSPQNDTFEYRENLLYRFRLMSEVDQNIYYTYPLEDLAEYLTDLLQEHHENIGGVYTQNSPLVSLKSLTSQNRHSFIQSVNTEGIVSSVQHYPIASLLKSIEIQ